MAKGGLYDTIVGVGVLPEYQGMRTGSAPVRMILDFVRHSTPAGGRASIQLITVTGKEAFYESLGFKRIPHEN